MFLSEYHLKSQLKTKYKLVLTMQQHNNSKCVSNKILNAAVCVKLFYKSKDNLIY